jgi:hypothetical protein
LIFNFRRAWFDFEDGPVRNTPPITPEPSIQAALLAAESVDFDKDGVANAFDNCPATPNRQQRDSDGNGVGNACEPIPGDVNTDGRLDYADLLAVLNTFGSHCGKERYVREIDVNRDCIINWVDVIAVVRRL